MSRITKAYCDVCAKEYQPGSYGETGELSLIEVKSDERTHKFKATIELCESCLNKVKKAITEIVPIKWKQEY